MKRIAFALLGPVLVSLGLVNGTDPDPLPRWAPPHSVSNPNDAYNEVIQEFCVRCHGDRIRQADLSLKEFDVANADQRAEVAEKMIRKLRTGLMPPAGEPRPDVETLTALVSAVETRMDETATPSPGARSFQRLNREEYTAAIRDLLNLDIDGADYLPLDTKSANFDNIADAQVLSATLLEAYLTAADEISRMAVGDPDAPVRSKTFTNTGFTTQWERVEGAPRGTRGGVSAMHNFPADGYYSFAMAFEHSTTGGFTGRGGGQQSIDISIDGERLTLVLLDSSMSVSDPNGANMWTDPLFVRAGPHRVTAAFLRDYDGPLDDPLSPYDWSLVTRGGGGSAMTVLPHMKDFVIKGPHKTTGVSDTPSRRKIFTRRPTAASEERAAAQEIIEDLGTAAFRRPLSKADTTALLGFYEEGAAERGFEWGIRTALQAILSSPQFVFRLEEIPAGVQPGETYRISDLDLATRLSFFLWGTIPDQELLALGIDETLSDPAVLDAQVRRMLKDPRSQALSTRFGAQWLRLDDLAKVQPDRLLFPNFFAQLADMMRKETELFFNSIVQEDRNVMDLLTADYTFVNDRLAKHYGLPNVGGHAFRKVDLPDENRRGLLGHSSILTLTSHADRTSAVLRGKWVMEVLLGSPPPPPPPNVPELEETEDAQDGRLLSVAERLELHRANPACNSCHRMIDPIGVALENFDVTGAWRIRDNLNPIIAETELYDGTPMASPTDLRDALVDHPEAFIRTFIQNLMAYGIGRRVEYYDMPTVRKIARQAAANGNRISSLILGVVQSPAFQMSQANAPETYENEKK